MASTINLTQVNNLGASMDHKQRIDQLNQIRVAAKHKDLGHKGPRTTAAWVYTAVIAAATGLLTILLVSMNISIDSLLILALPFLNGAVTFFAIQKFSSLPTSYAVEICRMLNEYDPVDKSSYAELQRTVFANYDPSSQAVIEWVSFEREAIAIASRASSPNPELEKFISKKV